MKSDKFFSEKAKSGGLSDHINRSIPGYEILQEATANITNYLTAGGSCGRITDIGCADASILPLLERSANCQYCGVDTNIDMIKLCRKNYFEVKNASFIHHETSRPLPPADVTICLFTMQFIAMSEKRYFFRKMIESLHDGGYLILGEKVRFNNILAETTRRQLLEHKLKHFPASSIVEKDLFVTESMPVCSEEELLNIIYVGNSVEKVEKFHAVAGFNGYLIRKKL